MILGWRSFSWKVCGHLGQGSGKLTSAALAQVARGRRGSSDHSNMDPSKTATSLLPRLCRTNAFQVAPIPAPQSVSIRGPRQPNPFLPHLYADRLGEATRADAVVKLRCGRWPPMEQPDAVARELLALWSRPVV